MIDWTSVLFTVVTISVIGLLIRWHITTNKEAAARHTLYREERKQWIVKHGSDALKELAGLPFGFEHDRLYLKERVLLERGTDWSLDYCPTWGKPLVWAARYSWSEDAFMRIDQYNKYGLHVVELTQYQVGLYEFWNDQFTGADHFRFVEEVKDPKSNWSGQYRLYAPYLNGWWVSKTVTYHGAK